MKKILTLFMTMAMIFAMTACNNNETSTNENVETEKVEIANFLDEYISELPDNKARESFESMFSTVQMSGRLLKRQMDGNNERYEFDPSTEVPEEIADKIDVSALLTDADFENHDNYKITIDGEDITIEFDGLTFYPCEYDLFDVEDYVEKHKVEDEEFMEE